MSFKRLPDRFGDLIGGSLPGKLAHRLPPKELALAWSELVGEAIAQRSRPVALERGGILVVAVKGGIWRQELSFQTPELLRRLRARGFILESIKLVLERTQAAAAPPPSPLPELDDLEEEEVQRAVASVKDPKLREALAGVRRAQMRARKAGDI